MFSNQLTIRHGPSVSPYSEAQLIALALDGVTSNHSRRSYRTGLVGFFAWIAASGSGPEFTRGLVQRYRSRLLMQGLSSSTINLRLAAIRKLAHEMADNQMLDSSTAAAIARVPNIKRQGTRIGNWLRLDQANALLNAPAADTLVGKRDRAILGLLISCGLRRAELIRIETSHLQEREGRWVLPDMPGKGNRLRTIPVPSAVKRRVDVWMHAAGITSGRIFRPVSKNGIVAGDGIKDEKTIWRLVVLHAKQARLGKLAPHDLRRTCARLCRKAGGELEQIQLLLGHVSIQTTEKYLGTEQAFAVAVNDAVGLQLGS